MTRLQDLWVPVDLKDNETVRLIFDAARRVVVRGHYYLGFCLACGELHRDVESKATGLTCNGCGKRKVDSAVSIAQRILR